MSRAPEQSEEVRAGPVKTVIYASVYISTSVALISFNKYLMHAGRFPHPVALTTLHMIAAWVCLFTLYCFKPSLFPAMEHAKAGPKCLGVVCDFGIYFIPLGLFFAVAITCSNYAYFYCAVPFLQFMKEANVVLVFCLSAAVGLQHFTRARFLAIAWIMAGATMAVTGEMKFAFVGFAFQALSQFGECAKNVLGEWMMTKSSSRLDPLTYTMSMAPVALVPLAIGALVSYDSSVLNDFLQHWHLILASALLAVALNVMISVFIRSCSAMAFILSGLFKDFFIVSVSAAAFGDDISHQQMLGFAVCLSGIAAWSSIKLKPELWSFLGPSDDERKLLIGTGYTSKSEP
mmetsp:Transcript_67014/g.146167  ORF Transcript_67014/g.146167 Transcript_67014/m.146167 type:complete len:346 (-) Transcript_67014:82-1119(-)